MTSTEFFERVTVLFEIVGVAVLLLGLLLSLVVAALAFRRQPDTQATVTTFRNVFGGALLLSLENLIAADLTRTVTVATTLENVLVLGVIVLIRTVLSISLDIEIDGVAPWHRRALESGATKMTRATRQAASLDPPRPP